MRHPHPRNYSKVTRVEIEPPMVLITRWYGEPFWHEITRHYRMTPARERRLSLDTIRKSMKVG